MLLVNRFILLVFVLVLSKACSGPSDPAIGQIDQFIAKQNIDKSQPDWKMNLITPPILTFSQDKQYLWQLETNQGRMLIEFMPNIAPMHVSSTIYLTRLGFYDGLTFHRVINGFMAQGGDPLGNGTGHPGYKYAGEFSEEAKHDKAGVLSMANAGPNTEGSQFFITFNAVSRLDGSYSVFGQLTEGLDTLKALESLGTASGKPKQTITISHAKIIVK